MSELDDVFTADETDEFIRLLKKIQEHGYWVPSLKAWQEVQRTFSRWAIEFVITSIDEYGSPRIFLTRYDGEGIPAYRGQYHLPGGFERLPESIEETCSRVAREELGGDVKYRGILGIHKWTNDESPVGSHLLSVYAVVEPMAEITISADQRFFTRNEVLALNSKEMASQHPHRIFIDQYLSSVESGITVEPITLGF